MEDLPQEAQPRFSFQLSSPVEEGVLSKAYDPLNNDPPPEESIIAFESVETSTATLVVTASDADIPLGSSSPLEVATLCKYNPMDDDTNKKYTTELRIAIVSDSGVAEVTEVDAKEMDNEDKSQEKATTTATDTDGGNDDVVAAVVAEAEEVTSIPPVCTATFRFTYTPSPKDQREDLYELLNKTSQRKATALEKLRKLSMAQAASASGASSSSTGASPSSSSTAMTRKPAVKPGFLNKKKGASTGKEPTGLRKMYDTMLGPNSYAMRGYGFVKGARNYIMFFGAMTFFHFRGQMLALPPPV